MIPMLRQLNPSVEQVLSETAEIARGEEEYWQEQVRSLLPKLLSKPGIENRRSAIRLDMLQGQPLALQRRLIRALAEQHDLRLEFHQIEDLLTALRSGTSALQIKVELPQGWEAVCRSGELWFRNRCQKLEEHAAYDLALTAPREIEVAGRKIRAEIVMGSELADARAPHASETRGTQVHVTQVLLAASLAEGHLRVRNWRAGDRYWPAHTREPKKVKELLLARHIPREQKPYWPVVVAGEEIVWVPGFEAPEQFRAQETDSAALLLVSEIPP
jgi:tRNA(Ile)-lysidine synthase